MPVPTQEQIKQWRARWGSPDNSRALKRISRIIDILVGLKTDYKKGVKELLEYLQKEIGITAMPYTVE